ncbi:MAG TPA: CoA transferase [Methylomirabilota bacterium]|jgi:crotonobetainyl-CoA:carnitine CoA-transferase CaiB-like acyl-CoA transferase|nr:CoA transferase [Methylomirabilota bacterium]
MALPLAGIRVLDIASMLAGPYGATMLGDMGADVIKIEPPYGDESRAIGVKVENDSGFYVGINRNKRGIVLDLTKPEGKELYFRLVRTADIIIDNLRPQAKAKLGVTYEENCQQNPKIICISVSAFGQDGPYAGRPGIDPLAQALSGLMSVTGERNGKPLKAGPAIADATCANLVAFAAMVGLWVREQQGVGQQIEVCLVDGQIHIQPSQVGQFFLCNYVQPRVGNASPFYAPYGTFTCRDGRDIQIASFNNKFFHNICRAVGREDLIDDPRFLTGEDRLAREPELNAEIQKAFSQFDADELLRRLAQEDCMAAPVNTYEQTFADPQVMHNQMAVEVNHARVGKVKVGGIPVKLKKTPGAVRLAPPTLGQHTREVLQELGLGDADLEKLLQQGVIK